MPPCCASPKMPGFGLSVQRLGTSPVPQSACPALDLTATAASRPSTARNVPFPWPRAAWPAARGTPKLGVAVSAGRGEAALGFPVPARRSADSQCPVDWSSGDSGRRAVHATLYCMPSTSPCQMAVCTNLTCHVSWSTFLADHGTDIPPIYNGLKFAYTYSGNAYYSACLIMMRVCE